MPINHQLIRQGRIFIETVQEPFTMAEIAIIIEFYQRQILDKATEPVITIVDFSTVTHVPRNMLSSSLTMLKKPHPMAGPAILVTKNKFLNDLANILSKAVPKVKFLVRPTMEKALEEADQLLSAENLAK